MSEEIGQVLVNEWMHLSCWRGHSWWVGRLVNIASSSLNATNPDAPSLKRWGSSSSYGRRPLMNDQLSPISSAASHKKMANPNNYDVVVVGAGNDVQVQRFCDVLPPPELATDEQFLTNADRVVSNRTELILILQQNVLAGEVS